MLGFSKDNFLVSFDLRAYICCCWDGFKKEQSILVFLDGSLALLREKLMVSKSWVNKNLGCNAADPNIKTEIFSNGM